MKKVYKIFLLAAISCSFLFQSCETIELEQIDNPNNLTVGDPQFLLNNIQTNYRFAQVLLNDESSDLARIDYFFGNQYLENLPDNTLNNQWNVLYSTIIPDIQAIELAVTEDNPLTHHLGMAKIMEAHLTMQLVDFLGDIIDPEQAGNPSEFENPALSTDGGASAYAYANALLDEAITLLNAGGSVENVQDFYYGEESDGSQSDPEKWIKLANTIKMRAALTTGDIPTFTSIANTGNFISEPADDFQWRFGTALTPVDVRHQDYGNDYTPSGANLYQSNWLMNLMDTTNDPRIRYYFHRQNDCTPGASCRPDGNAETLNCSIQATPAHLVGLMPAENIWCYLENGYWGRFHGNDEGTPPDNFTRTAVGVYPAGGLFDGDDFMFSKDLLCNQA